MKFARELKEALHSEGFPSHWVESAIPYGHLKKSIRKVEAELRSFGLDAETLRHLNALSHNAGSQNVCHTSGDAAVAFQYYFAVEDPSAFRPILMLYLQLDDFEAVNGSLSPETRNYTANLANKRRQPDGLLPGPEDDSERDYFKNASALQTVRLRDGIPPSSFINRGAWDVKLVVVPLTFDAEFFEIIQNDMTTLDALHAEEQKKMSGEITALGKEVAKLTNPSKYRKSDIGLWRELFDIYLQAGIFFSTNELDHGSRNCTAAAKQLQWFQNEVSKRSISLSFKIPASQQVFDAFTSLNTTLLRNMKFREINQLALKKILKKFDKHTSLGARDNFPSLIKSNRITSETMAKAMCSEMTKEIVKIVPQLDDYLCPVCFSISYKPVRLTCGHVFCIRCMITMQKAQDRFCPLCRDEVIMHADSENIDASLMRFLRRYFPDETKMKQKENEIAAGVDFYGESYADAKCILM